VVPTNAADGCDPIAPAMSRLSQFVLLVARGNCTFAEKARVSCVPLQCMRVVCVWCACGVRICPGAV
jgi:hypothetical protein